MPRLDIARQMKLEPIRIKKAKKQLIELGIEITFICPTRIEFKFKGNIIKYFPYSGWHTGKGIVDGRGGWKLFDQLKEVVK